MEERTELADKSLITAVKMISEMRRATNINSVYKQPAFIAKLGQNCRPTLNFALHMGWTIEGSIGSDSKIDASYMSPHLQASYKIENLCEHYDQQILVSETLYNIMSLKARNTLRKIDVIVMKKEHREALGIYTYDLSFGNMDQLQTPEDHEVGDLIKLAEYETINIESFKNKGVDYMFTLDSDLVGLQQHIGEFTPIFRLAFKEYVAGNWEDSLSNIDRCLELWDTDGPTKAMKWFMQFYRYQSPSNWEGCRDIDEPIDLEKIQAENNYGEDDDEDKEDQDDKKGGSKSGVESGKGSKS